MALNTSDCVPRPLFSDFWERFLACLEELKQKGQRTVYRLTLVKKYNMTDVSEYVALVKLARRREFCHLDGTPLYLCWVFQSG